MFPEIPEQPKRDIKEYHGASTQKVRKTKAKVKMLLSHLVAKAVDAGPSAESVYLIEKKGKKRKTYLLV